MPLDPATLLALAAACAPQVAPDTLVAVVRVESAGDPLAIGVNGPHPRRLSARTPAEAVAVATRLLAEGRSVDLGLGQINGRNLVPLGLSVAAAFDPCRNLASAAQVLRSGWRRTAPGAASPLAALKTAFSLYNTGDRSRGLANGYAARVVAAASAGLPGEKAQSADPSPRWLVFARPTGGGFVITPEEEARP